jgi:hypothetical protein
MGDRTFHHGKIIATTPALAAEIGEAIGSQLGAYPEYSDADQVKGRVVTWDMTDTHLGATDEVITLAAQIDPHIQALAYEAPVYEYPGELYILTGKETKIRTCDADGNVVLTYEGVTRYATVEEAFAVPELEAFAAAYEAALNA